MKNKVLKIADHSLPGAVQLPSTNCNQRLDEKDINLLVIHNISLPAGKFGGPWIDDLFLNRLDASAHPSFVALKGLKVSSHLLIRRNGEIHQYVPFHKRAWHAGKSSYQGRENCNDYSIGIELEGTDDSPYSNPQYSVLTEITLALLLHYPRMSENRITGHQHIAPARKTDPGPAFDWQRFHGLLTDWNHNHK